MALNIGKIWHKCKYFFLGVMNITNIPTWNKFFIKKLGYKVFFYKILLYIKHNAVVKWPFFDGKSNVMNV